MATMPKYHRAMNAFIGNHGDGDPRATDRGEAVHALAEIAGVAEIEGAVVPVRSPHPSAELDVPGQELGVDLLALGQPEAGADRPDHVIVAAADRQVGQPVALPFPVGVRADAAEVEQAEAAVGPEQVVTRVRVGVEQAAGVVEAAPGLDDQAAEVVPQFLGRVAGQEGVDVDPVEVLHREHPPRAEFVVDAGDEDRVVLVEQ